MKLDKQIIGYNIQPRNKPIQLQSLQKQANNLMENGEEYSEGLERKTGKREIL